MRDICYTISFMDLSSAFRRFAVLLIDLMLSKLN